MPAFPRDLIPRDVSAFSFPGALQSEGGTGKSQLRSTLQVGRMWEEVWGPKKGTDPLMRKLIAVANQYWREGTIFDIDHRHYPTHLGGGTGTCLVNGAGQTGSSLITDGWAGANPILKTGDIISVVGLSVVLDIMADVNRSGVAATLPISPGIFVGNSPADNAVVTYTGVRINAKLVEQPPRAIAGANGYIIGYRLVFKEQPS